jgi:chemotaxis protein methyltransferase CheR
MSWSDPAFAAAARLVTQRTGLSFPPSRQDSAEAAMRRAMKGTACPDAGKLRQRLEAEGRAFDALVDDLTVGETYFFREPAQFEFLRREVLPEICRRRGTDHELRAWSAGCASGEEAFSLAMVCAELGLAGRIHLLATDLSRTALVRARRATFGAWSFRDEGMARAQPYLTRSGTAYTVDKRIRRLVTFAHLNLAADGYPSFANGTWGMDLILCRNVLIYFDPEAIGKVVQCLFSALAPGGWLLTASSDPPVAQLAPFETVLTEAGVFCRRPLDAERPEVQKPEDLRPWPVLSEASDGDRLPTVPPSLPVRKEQGSDLSFRADQPCPSDEVLADAHRALARGDYRQAAILTGPLLADPVAAGLHIRALANLDAAQAERACAAAVQRHALQPELHYLHAVLLIDHKRDEEAAHKLRQVIYLDRSLAIAHFTLGALLVRRGDPAGARRAYRNARELCARRPADEEVPLAEGERAGRLAEAAAYQLALLDAAGGTPS